MVGNGIKFGFASSSRFIYESQRYPINSGFVRTLRRHIVSPRMRFWLFSFVLLISFEAMSQSLPAAEPIRLSGVIVNEADEALPFVTVTNLRTQQGVVSDEAGFFYLTFFAQDTLQLSAVNYEAYQLYFGDTAQATNYDLTVRLSEKTYQLENVTVFAFRDEAAFKRAILALDDLPEPEKVVIPGTYQGPRREKKASIGSPISFILDRFSKRAKYERQVQQAQQEATYQKALSKKFNRAMIEEITGLNEERLDEFILFCRLEDRFIEESNEYDIIVAINNCYRDFQQQN